MFFKEWETDSVVLRLCKGGEFLLDNLLGHKSMLDDEVRKQFERLEEARTNLANERLRFTVRLREIIGDARLEQLNIEYEKLRQSSAEPISGSF